MEMESDWVLRKPEFSQTDYRRRRLRQKERPCKKAQRCKSSDRGETGLLVPGGRRRDKSWKFAPSRGRVHRACNDSI